MKIHFLPFLDTFVSKIRENVSRNRRNDKKCLEIGENVFSHFWTLLGLEIRENVSRNRKNLKSVTYAGPEQPFRCLEVEFGVGCG